MMTRHSRLMKPLRRARLTDPANAMYGRAEPEQLGAKSPAFATCDPRHLETAAYLRLGMYVCVCNFLLVGQANVTETGWFVLVGNTSTLFATLVSTFGRFGLTLIGRKTDDAL